MTKLIDAKVRCYALYLATMAATIATSTALASTQAKLPIDSIAPPTSITHPTTNIQLPEPQYTASVMPLFEEQDHKAFLRWVMERVSYPIEVQKQRIAGTVVVSFIVEADGTLSTSEILSSPSPLLSQEVLRVVASSPIWSPGRSEQGEKLRVKLSIPIRFTLAPTSEADATTADEPLLIADKMPRFKKGGLDAFRNWVKSEIQYTPQMAEAKALGKVIASFVIEKNGSVSNVAILTSSHPLLSDEAQRVLLSSPLWEPAQKNGEAVRIKFTLPISITP